MSTTINERRTDARRYSPQMGESGESVEIKPRGEQSVARRFFARFALIAFGLYHLPLFINNYPSLGGGGFKDDGLAPRWGHIFTPAGMWVARHLFHMTGPMPFGSGGDNGDVGEEWGRLILCVAIGLVGGLVWTAIDVKRPRGKWVDDANRLLLRYSIALGLVSYAIGKLLPQQFPPLTTAGMETRLGEMTPMSLLWTFMEYSRPYAFFGGLMELMVVVLLCFRRTATLGAIVCIAVMSNVAALNWMYGVPVKLYSTMLVVSAAVLVLYDWRRLLAVFVMNRPAEAVELSSAIQDRISPPLRWTIKIALVGSVVASSIAVMAHTLHPAPITGVKGSWLVTSFSRDGKSLDSTGDARRWRHMTSDDFSFAVRMETDSLMRCQRTNVGADSISLKCSRNRTGSLQWTRAGDTLRLDGMFDGSRMSAVARVVDSASYPLFRSRFRLIFDR